MEKKMIAVLLAALLALTPTAASADEQRDADITVAVAGLTGGVALTLLGGYLMHQGVKSSNGHVGLGGLGVLLIGVGIGVLGGYCAARAADDSTVGAVTGPLTAGTRTTLAVSFPF